MGASNIDLSKLPLASGRLRVKAQEEFPLSSRVVFKDDLDFSVNRRWGEGFVTGYAFEAPHKPLVRPDGWAHSVQFKYLKPKFSASGSPRESRLSVGSGSADDNANSLQDNLSVVTGGVVQFPLKGGWKEVDQDVKVRDKKTGQLTTEKRTVRVPTTGMAVKTSDGHADLSPKGLNDRARRWESSSLGGLARVSSPKSSAQLTGTEDEESSNPLFPRYSYQGSSDGGNSSTTNSRNVEWLSHYRGKKTGLCPEMTSKKVRSMADMIPEVPDFYTPTVKEIADEFKDDLGGLEKTARKSFAKLVK